MSQNMTVLHSGRCGHIGYRDPEILVCPTHWQENITSEFPCIGGRILAWRGDPPFFQRGPKNSENSTVFTCLFTTSRPPLRAIEVHLNRLQEQQIAHNEMKGG